MVAGCVGLSIRLASTLGSEGELTTDHLTLGRDREREAGKSGI